MIDFSLWISIRGERHRNQRREFGAAVGECSGASAGKRRHRHGLAQRHGIQMDAGGNGFPGYVWRLMTGGAVWTNAQMATSRAS